MANEKWIIDANALLEKTEHTDADVCADYGDGFCRHGFSRLLLRLMIRETPTVDAVEVEKYKRLVEMYHELRENFIDYVCSGVPNVAPYCLNKRRGCTDCYGWCKKDSDKCRGFNPAEVIIDGERKDNE